MEMVGEVRKTQVLGMHTLQVEAGEMARQGLTGGADTVPQEQGAQLAVTNL